MVLRAFLRGIAVPAAATLWVITVPLGGVRGVSPAHISSHRVCPPSATETREPSEPAPTPTTHHHILVGGHVQDRMSTAPVLGATVTMTDCHGWSQSAMTNEAGAYDLGSGWTNGSFACCHLAVYHVEAAGYQSADEEQYVPEVDRQGHSLGVDFRLDRLAGRTLFLPVLANNSRPGRPES